MSSTIGTEWAGCWTEEFWVQHCEGFSVEGPDGETGIVEAVRCGPEGDVEALVVREYDGGAGRRCVIPAAHIRSVDPTHELVLLCTTPSRHIAIESAAP